MTWYERNRERAKAQSLAWYYKNREAAKARILARYHANEWVRDDDRFRKSLRRNRKPADNGTKAHRELKDYKLRAYLKRLTGKQPTQQEIEQCRQRLQLRRAAKLLRMAAAAASLSRISTT